VQQRGARFDLELGRGEVDLAVDLEGRQVGDAEAAPPLDGEDADRTAAEALLPDFEVLLRRAAGAVQGDDPALDPA
jgi:hypothetical protein